MKNGAIRRASSWAPAAFAIVSAVCAAGAFSRLGLNSLWIDELYTAYFSDPALSLGEFFSRANADVHAPLYYSVIYLIRHAGLDYELTARGFSAVAAVLSLLGMVLLFRRELSFNGRLFACAFAATSATWFNQAQNARSYTLSFLATLGLAFFSLRLMRAKSDRDFFADLAAFTVMAIVASFVHYYLVPAAGGFLLYALIASTTHRRRAAIIASGLAILAVVGGFIAWQRTQHQVSVEDLWFTNSSAHLLNAGRWTVKGFAGSLYGLAALALILPLALFPWLQTIRKEKNSFAPLLRDILSSPAGCLAFALVFSSVSYLAISFFITPIISQRILVPLLPLGWLLAGLAYDGATRRANVAPIVALAAAALMTLAGLRTYYRFVPTATEDMRTSAEFVSAHPECASGVIPAAFVSSSVNASGVGTFYGYYLPEEFKGALRSVEATTLPANEAWNAYAALKARGEDLCPVALWGVHFLTEHTALTAQARAEAIAEQHGAVAHLVTFPTTDIPFHGLPFLAPLNHINAAYVILLQPGDDAPQAADVDG